MQDSLFRQKSLDHISSPEALHDYMRVTSPRLWMILAAIVILLAGFIVYASTATMESTMEIRVQLESYEVQDENDEDEETRKASLAYGRLPISMMDTVKTGMTVRIGKEEGKISFISAVADENQMTLLIDMDHEYVPMPDGEYDAVLVLEKTTPISFLWN